MDVQSIVKEVRQRLEAAANPERREYEKGYFPTSMDLLGVAVPDIRVIARGFSKRVKDETAEEVLKLVEAIIADGTMEGRQAAYEILVRHKPALAILKTSDIERLGKGMDNWASVDEFSTKIAGPAWRQGQVTDASIKRWARSKDVWWRRAALASTVALNLKSRGGKGDVPRTLMVCEVLADDHEDMVVKALSWALRQLVDHDRASVEDFLDRHDEELASRVKREVRTKLKTGYKNVKKS